LKSRNGLAQPERNHEKKRGSDSLLSEARPSDVEALQSELEEVGKKRSSQTLRGFQSRDSSGAAAVLKFQKPCENSPVCARSILERHNAAFGGKVSGGKKSDRRFAIEKNKKEGSRYGVNSAMLSL